MIQPPSSFADRAAFDAPAATAAADRAWQWILPSLAVVVGCSAYWQLFSIFRFWDDEGYILISLRNFAEGGSLYREVYSQYGPFYNLLFGLGHRFLGFPLDATGARWSVWAIWLITTLAVAILARRATRSNLWAVTAASALFVLLRHLTHEPAHPVGLVVLLVGPGTVLAALALHAGREARAGVIVAVVGTLLALVKINVGLFYLAGAGVFLLWSTAIPLAQRWARFVVIALAVVAGVVLMRPLLGEAWVQTFALVYAVATATTLLVLALEIEGRAPTRSLVGPMAAAAITAGIVLGAAMLFSVGPTQLLDGIIRGPLKHPTGFSFPFRWSGLTQAVLAANILGLVLWLALRRSRPLAAGMVVASARVVAGMGLFVSFFHAFATSVENYMLSFGVGFLWALAAPLGEVPAGWRRVRQLLAPLALLQILHAFPVAGTQVGAGTFLLALLLMLGLAETALWLRARFAASALRFTAIGLATAGCALSLWGFVVLTRESAQRYQRHPPESFTGAGLHLSPWQSSCFATLLANAHAYGDMLFSLPGLYSFNLWSQLPTPNRHNITQWWSLLDEQQQDGIAKRLAAASRPVIIVQRNLITAGLAKDSYRPSLLTRVIERDFHRVFILDSYEFWVRQGVEIQPLLLGRWEPAGAFTFHAMTTDLTRARHVEFRRYAYGPDDPPVTLRDIHLAATSATAGQPAQWTCTLPAGASLDRTLCDSARFYDEAGALLAEVRFPRPEPQANPE